MQKTRQKILDYLRQHGPATVEQLSDELDNLTSVTVRHHLDILRSQGLVGKPVIRHRNTPGRPKYVYELTDKADSLFPRNLGTFTEHLLTEIKNNGNGTDLNVLFEAVSKSMAAEFEFSNENGSPENRLDQVVEHLTEHGYEARWEANEKGYMLYTANCPYGSVAQTHPELCMMDSHYLAQLVGAELTCENLILDGDPVCSYLITFDQIGVV